MRRDAGDPEQALQSFRRALLIAEELADSNPTITAFASKLATCLNDIGDLQRQAGQRSEAAPVAHAAALDLSKTGQDQPDRHGLSERSGQQSQLHRHRAERERRRWRGLAHTSRRSRSDRRWPKPIRRPHGFRAISQTATAISATSSATEGAGGVDQIVRAGIGDLSRLLAGANPAVTEFRSNLALCHINIGQLKRQTGRPAEALRSFREALALKESVPQPGAAGLYDLACLLSQMRRDR